MSPFQGFSFKGSCKFYNTATPSEFGKKIKNENCHS